MIAAAPQGARTEPGLQVLSARCIFSRGQPPGRDARMVQVLRWFWAAPASALGLMCGVFALATGGRLQRRGATLEFYGGMLARLLDKLPSGPCIMAMTLGHVILGRDGDALDYARAHELVHVSQYERWGPLFIPAYLACSAILWLRGADAYRDNPFERQAYAIAP